MGIDKLGGATATTRVPSAGSDAEQAWRDTRDAAALAYLERTGNADLVPMLGLDGQTVAPPRCELPSCGASFIPSRPRQRFCSKGCGLEARRAS